MVSSIGSTVQANIGLMDRKNRWVIFPESYDSLNVDQVGGKAANLHRLSSIATIVVPPWFVVSSSLFKEYLEKNEIWPLIDELEKLCPHGEDDEKIRKISEKIQKEILGGKFEKETFEEIQSAYKDLLKKRGSHTHVAVRSSGVIEDSLASSCAGLYDSILNVQGIESVLDGIKSVWASSFKMKIIQERVRLGLKQQMCMMGVVVQELIDARASGVASSMVLGNYYPGTQIAANFGMGVSVVDGEVSPDSWILHHEKSYILEQFCGSKHLEVRSCSEQGTKTIPVADALRKKFCLKESEVLEIGRSVSEIQKFYNCDIDVEFAVDSKGLLFILQARPLVSTGTDTKVLDLKDLSGLEPIARGNFSVPGVATGRVVFIPDWESLASGRVRLHRGDIAVAFVTTNTWSQYLGNIEGIITCEGSPSSHSILLSREKGIPCVIGMPEEIFKTLLSLNGKEVTIDGHNQKVYEGVLPTKNAEISDLMHRFDPVEIKPSFTLAEMLPSWIHNKMVLEREGQYWRKTPTFPIKGFQAEINLRRFAYIGEIIEKPDVKIEGRFIEGYVCFPLKDYDGQISFFEGMSLPLAKNFHQRQRKCMKDYMDLSSRFEWESDFWEKYIEISAKFRGFTWLGGLLRTYVDQKIGQLGRSMHLPKYYLDECAHAIQSEIPELDTQMHQEIHEFALEMSQESNLSQGPQTVDALKESNPTMYQKFVSLAHRYRFEHQISLHRPIDYEMAYQRIRSEVEQIRRGHVFTTQKNEYKDHEYLPNTELSQWLRISIESRLLQSDSHHLEARSKALMRPQLLEFGRVLVEKGILSEVDQIFDASVQQIAQYIKEVKSHVQ